MLESYKYLRRYQKDDVCREYYVYGDAYCYPLISTYIRPKTYEHQENKGIDRISVSFPRRFLNEKNFKSIKHYSKYLTIQVKKSNVWINFQRELFQQDTSFVLQLESLIIDLFRKNGLFKFPITFKTSNSKTIKKYKNITTPVEQFRLLMNSIKLQEIEIFFDNKEDIYSDLIFMDDDVKGYKSTIYSNDFKPLIQRKYSKKSLVKIYNKLDALGRLDITPSVYERTYPIRIEFTLRKEQMSYFSLKGLDDSSSGIISSLTPALATYIEKKAQWIKSVVNNSGLDSILVNILNSQPKKVLKMSRAIIRRLKGEYGNLRSGDVVEKMRDAIYIKDNGTGRNIDNVGNLVFLFLMKFLTVLNNTYIHIIKRIFSTKKIVWATAPPTFYHRD